MAKSTHKPETTRTTKTIKPRTGVRAGFQDGDDYFLRKSPPKL